MKVNATKELDKETLLSHIILEGLTNAIKDHDKLENFLSKNRDDNNNAILDIKLTINDIEIDLQKFVDLWESQVSRMIKEQAQSLISEKIGDIQSKLNDLDERVQSEIEQKLYDWEKNLNKELNHVFIDW